MSILSCPEGTQLIDNLSEAMRRQCEHLAEAKSMQEVAREMETAEEVCAATRHAADHLLQCPICRTN
jgi:NADH:ubiquinone oxidoreductase subunit F (NADH-binding)